MAPIFTSLSRNVVIDQCSTSFGKASVLIPDPAKYGMEPTRTFYTKIAGVTRRAPDGADRQRALLPDQTPPLDARSAL